MSPSARWPALLRERVGLVSDLNKIVAMQNGGQIARIYTTSMAGQFEEDLRTLKQEHGIEDG
jgi:hypothetical protein